MWVWGDEERKMSPSFLSREGGLNGTADKRLQRYIAARLGPLPGWTMGYGFDLHEWVNESILDQWHDNMQQHLGWKHLLGARSKKNKLDQISERMDYSSYEQHRPDYDKYVETIAIRANKPAFSEDRFRTKENGWPNKDYTIDDMRRGLWHSTMAGGVANIWGNLQRRGFWPTMAEGVANIWGYLQDGGSDQNQTGTRPFPNPEWFKTYSEFFEDRFHNDLVRCSSLTNGVCLNSPSHTFYIFYKENTSSISMDLSRMDVARKGIAVDTRKEYVEINIVKLDPINQTWTAPYQSDWAIAVDQTVVAGGSDTVPPQNPNGILVQ